MSSPLELIQALSRERRECHLGSMRSFDNSIFSFNLLIWSVDRRSNASIMRAATTVLLAAAAALAAASGPIRNTTNGLVQGKYESTTESYLGIPFAAPPVGDLRWQPPVAAKSWSGVRQATSFGNACPQHSAFTFGVNASEDCLYLNVYAPKNASSAKPLPVSLAAHCQVHCTRPELIRYAGGVVLVWRQLGIRCCQFPSLLGNMGLGGWCAAFSLLRSSIH